MKAFELVYASELEKVIRESRALLVDIREREDYKQGHWPGAVNYPYDELDRGSVCLPRNRKVILYCEHGGGSMQIARKIGQEGYKIATVVGGYEAMKKVQENYFKFSRNM